jgi:FAD/FMN-containing dehydrogenase
MLTASAFQAFKSRFRGDVLLPADRDYDAARTVFNAMIDRRPAVIARCTSPEDVAEAVNFGREQNLIIAVRAAGHNVAGYAVCDDGLVIDLSRMKTIDVDPARRTVRAGPGLTWGELNDELQKHDLAATGGFVSTTGVSGLTLGGGLGWLVRKHGLALDNLISADMVLADGSLVTASESENGDLFWAIRGGGGNFGIVTSFEFRVHPAGTMLAGIVLHPAAKAVDAIRLWRDFEATAPEESTQGALLFHFPDDPNGPPPLRGAALVGLGGVYAGPIEEGERVLQPLRAFGPPMVDLFQPTPYNAAQKMADFLFPPQHHNYWKSSYLERLSDAAVDVIAHFFSKVPSKQTVVILEHNGNGAMERVPEAATAFGHRRWPYNFLVISAWADERDTDRNITWTREFFAAMEPFLAKTVYLNYLGEDAQDRLMAAFGPAKYGRLVALKLKYDPTNLFRMNQNIQPVTPNDVAVAAR